MNRTAPATARRAQRVFATLVALVLVAPLVPVPGAAAADAAPAAGSFAVPGTARTGVWTVTSPTSASAAFPGNGGELAPLTADIAPAAHLAMADSGSASLDVQLTQTNAVRAGCVAGASLGELRHCGSMGTLRLTFPRPVADPVVKLAFGGGALDGGASCTQSWPTARVTRVNGQAPGDGASIAPGTHPAHVWDAAAARLVPDVASMLPKTRCSADMMNYTPVAFSGLVTSVELEISLSAAITILSGSPTDAPAAGSLRVAPSVPVADLQVTTDAVRTVDPAGQVTWDVAVRNAGTGVSHGFVVQDAVPAGVSDASVVTAPEACVLDGHDLVCTNPPPRCAVSPNAVVDTLLDLTCATSTRDATAVVLGADESYGTITLTGTAPEGRGTVVTDTARVSGVDFDTDVTNNVAAVDTEVVAPTLTVGKQLDARLAPADQFTVTAAGPDATVAAVTTAGTALSAASAPVQVSRGQAYTITEVMAAGSASELSRYRGRLVCTDQDGVVQPAEGTGPWTFTPTENREYTCVVTNTVLDRSFSVQKTASVATVHPGGTVEYRLTVTHTGSAPYTATDPAVLVDDLSGVLDDATPTGDVSGGAVLDGSTLRWSGALAAGETVTISYPVRVHDTFTGDRTLLNTVTTPPGSGGSCPAAPLDRAAPAGCSTSTPVEEVEATVLVEKVGDGSDGMPQRLPGAQFEVLADDAGAPGATLTGAALTGAGGTGSGTGLFAFQLLAPGTYWLREVAAPGSFVLLAEPVQFAVAPSGAVRLTDPEAHPQVTVTGVGSGTLTVHDVAALSLPRAGGAGTTLVRAAAVTLLVLAAGAVLVRARREPRRTPRHL